MTIKKIGCIIVVLAMLFALVACDNSAKDDKATAAPDDSETTVAAETEEVMDEEPTELVMVHALIGPSPADLDLVIGEINDHLINEINATLKPTLIAIQDYNEQVRLMLTAGEQIDLLQTGTLMGGQFANQAASGQLAPLDDLMEQYGQGMKEVTEQFLAAGTIQGTLYGVPSMRDQAKAAGLAIDKEYVDKYNIDVDSINSLEDLEPIFEEIKAAEPDIALFHPGPGATSGIDNGLHMPGGDTLGSDYYFTGVLLDATDSSLEVVNFFETQEYKDQLDLIRKWNLAGYLLPGVSTITDEPFNYVKAGELVSYVLDVKPGVTQQTSQQCGKEMIVIDDIYPAIQYTDVPAAFLWTIPTNSIVKEKAMEFMNLMFTDSTLVNMYDYGIEGKHYMMKDDGTITYAEGVDAQTSGYSVTVSFIFGNQFISHVWEGNPADYWDQMDAFNKSAVVSEAFGFQFDIEPVKNELASCTNVYNQYARALGTGSVDPEEVLPEFISKLQEAGSDAIIAEKQRQLDEWAANK